MFKGRCASIEAITAHQTIVKNNVRIVWCLRKWFCVQNSPQKRIPRVKNCIVLLSVGVNIQKSRSSVEASRLYNCKGPPCPCLRYQSCPCVVPSSFKKVISGHCSLFAHLKKVLCQKRQKLKSWQPLDLQKRQGCQNLALLKCERMPLAIFS